jgi:hypothetical protein
VDFAPNDFAGTVRIAAAGEALHIHVVGRARASASSTSVRSRAAVS